jgi:hypothetical protein
MTVIEVILVIPFSFFLTFFFDVKKLSDLEWFGVYAIYALLPTFIARAIASIVFIPEFYPYTLATSFIFWFGFPALMVFYRQKNNWY